MKVLSKITKGLIPVLAGAFIAISAIGQASAVPYTGDTTQPLPRPQFNAYTGVPSEGDERDFFRGKVAGDSAPSRNVVDSTCETGKRFQLRVYVHNGASQHENGNGDGPSVAKNTTVKVDLKNANAASTFNPDASISASNAATVTDGMTIRCTDGRVVKLNYIAGSAAQYSRTGSKPLSDTIVTTGAKVGTDQPDGNVWGCWEQRVYVTFLVEVKEKPEPPKPSKGECKVTELTPLGGRKVRASVTGTTDNAEIIGYEIDFGDGNKSNQQTTEHEYAQDGTYTVTGRVHVKYADGKTEWKSAADCVRKITFQPDVPPVVPPVTPPVTPPTLPSTGPAGLVAIVSAISIAAGVAHRAFTARRLGA